MFLSKGGKSVDGSKAEGFIPFFEQRIKGIEGSTSFIILKPFIHVSIVPSSE